MRFVAPLVGAWIEITIQALANITYITSHPSWVRGLKFFLVRLQLYKLRRRTPRGCVD